MLGVDEQDARADRIGGLDAAQQDVLEKRAAEAGALVLAVDGEPGEQDRRHRARAWLPLERSRSRVFRSDLRGGERVVADDGLAVLERRHEDTGGVGCLGGVRMSLQPLVECGLAALELVEAMALPERLGALVRHALLGGENARLGEELLKTGLFLRRAVEELDEAVPLLGL